MTHLFRSVLLVAFVALVVSACSPAPAPKSGSGGIVVSNAWTMATPPGAAVGAGYMTISNQAAAVVRLTGGSSAAAQSVEVHNMTMDGGVMQMRPVEGGLEIPANGAVELKPGGLHLMLIGLQKPLAEGESVPVTLTFDDGTRVDVVLAVRAMGGGGHDH
jgi:periplasmic copper chaperone A